MLVLVDVVQLLQLFLRQLKLKAIDVVPDALRTRGLRYYADVLRGGEAQENVLKQTYRLNERKIS